MSGRKLYYIMALLVGTIVLYISWNSFTQEGVQDLEGDFKRLAFIRNENNVGPVERVYAVSLTDTLWEEMQQYGNFMPHTKYGNTKVYFFLDDQPAPAELADFPAHIAPAYQPYCLAKYEKDGMGNISLQKYPFR